jgi:hypothetical protein
MKYLFRIAAVALLALVPFVARAQFDQFAGPRFTVLTSPQQITAARTNDVIDIHGYEGIGAVVLMSSTNSENATSTMQLVGSPDRTNWTIISNYAIGVPLSKIYTNNYYGSGTPLATNIFVLPGTNTTPTAATAGFATPYNSTAPFTNSGSFTITNYAVIGFVIPDQARYLGIDWMNGGGQTNSVGAFFIGKKQDQ